MQSSILEISVYVPGILEIPSVSVNTGIVFSELPIPEDALVGQDGEQIVLQDGDTLLL